MIDKFKNNTKIKIISLLSAIVLWLYVMAVVDPDETRVIEGIPISITNMNELKEKDLEIYPEIELKANIEIAGKLSDVQKVKREDIQIHGQINEPKEGNNYLYLKANLPGKITHTFKENFIIIPLEKIVNEKRLIKIKIDGKEKNNVDNIELSEESVTVSGPRSLVNKVQNVVGNLDVGNNTNDFTSKLKLIPVDEKGKEVEGVSLENTHVNVSVTLLRQKEVPIKIVFKEGSQQPSNIKNYELSQETIIIKGKKETVDKIDFISTEPLDLSDITEDISKKVYLNIPEGVLVDTKSITIKLNTVKKITSEFTYNSSDIQVRNNETNIDITQINIPNDIKVIVEYTDEISNLLKSDIILYIDLSGGYDKNKKYEIKYETKYQLNNITIEPNTIVSQ